MSNNKYHFFYHQINNNLRNRLFGQLTINCVFKIILTCLIGLNLFSISANAKTSKSEWVKHCSDESKIETCRVVYEIKLEDKEETRLGSAMLFFANEVKRNLDVLDKDEKTFTLKETTKRVPMLFFDLPLNVDLRTPAYFRIDKGEQVSLSYLFCKSDVGCRCGGKIETTLLRLFKAGNELTLSFKVYGGNEDFHTTLSLKGFTAQFKNLK